MFRSCQINLLLSDSQMSWYYLIWYLLYSGAFDSFYHISKNPSFHRIRHYSRDRWGDVWERIHDASPQASSYSCRGDRRAHLYLSLSLLSLNISHVWLWYSEDICEVKAAIKCSVTSLFIFITSREMINQQENQWKVNCHFLLIKEMF